MPVKLYIIFFHYFVRLKVTALWFPIVRSCVVVNCCGAVNSTSTEEVLQIPASSSTLSLLFGTRSPTICVILNSPSAVLGTD